MKGWVILIVGLLALSWFNGYVMTPFINRLTGTQWFGLVWSLATGFAYGWYGSRFLIYRDMI